MKTFYPALIIMSRDDDGEIDSIRATATRFSSVESAKKRYGEVVIRLLDIESEDKTPFFAPIELK